MIIASPAKKEISIPLQPMTSAAVSSSSSNNNNKVFEIEEAAAVDLVTVNSRSKDTNDFIVQVFGQASIFNTQVEETLSITTTQSIDKSFLSSASSSTMRKLVCEAFIHNNTVFLSSPFVGSSNAGLLNWADGEFQSCITHLIELAEEKTGCGALIVSIDRKNYKENLSTILRAFMYLGFEMVDPAIYRQEPGYLLVGYEL